MAREMNSARMSLLILVMICLVLVGFVIGRLTAPFPNVAATSSKQNESEQSQERQHQSSRDQPAEDSSELDWFKAIRITKIAKAYPGFVEIDAGSQDGIQKDMICDAEVDGAEKVELVVVETSRHFAICEAQDTQSLREGQSVQFRQATTN